MLEDNFRFIKTWGGGVHIKSKSRDRENIFRFDLYVNNKNDYFIWLYTLFQFCFFLIVSNGG